MGITSFFYMYLNIQHVNIQIMLYFHIPNFLIATNCLITNSNEQIWRSETHANWTINQR